MWYAYPCQYVAPLGSECISIKEDTTNDCVHAVCIYTNGNTHVHMHLIMYAYINLYVASID